MMNRFTNYCIEKMSYIHKTLESNSDPLLTTIELKGDDNGIAITSSDLLDFQLLNNYDHVLTNLEGVFYDQ